MPSNSYRILLVDDHQMLRDGLRLLIGGYEEFEVVGEAQSGETALLLIEKLLPDVVVVDLGLPGMSGLEVIQQIRNKPYDCKIIVLTMHGEHEMIAEAFKVGSNGFIPKSAAHTHLLEAIHAVLRGERYLHPDSAVEMMEKVTNRFEKTLLLKDLSEREVEVFTLTALGYTRSEISEQLTISPKTVDTYRQRALEKLNLKTRAELVQFALQAGIMQNEDQRI